MVDRYVQVRTLKTIRDEKPDGSVVVYDKGHLYLVTLSLAQAWCKASPPEAELTGTYAEEQKINADEVKAIEDDLKPATPDTSVSAQVSQDSGHSQVNPMEETQTEDPEVTHGP